MPLKKIKLKPKAVLFDMDGVIVDSMPYHFLAWYEALRPLGIRIGCFEVYAREGERWDKTLKDLLRRTHINPSKQTIAKIFTSRQKIFKSIFKRSLFNGAFKLLSCFKERGFALGLVTGTPDKEIERILPKKVLRIFDVVIPGNKVPHGKPHPAPYLLAALRLGLTPLECVVIENAPLGITSAKRAGMFCIALTTSLPAEYLKGADIVVNELAELTDYFETRCRP